MKISAIQKNKFKREILGVYKKIKRDSLPWRKTTDPYSILVSEVMLQQTQVERVIPKYIHFLKLFPTITDLAQSHQITVLQAWQGLGYNRRALFLKRTAEAVASTNSKTKFPKKYEELLKLPGIGQSTAGALMNFAFNIPTPFIETNIRTVYLHHFFKKKSLVSDTDILSVVAQTMDQKNPREWFYALYDYGTYLKSMLGKKKVMLHQKSESYTKQSIFKGSYRQMRGATLRAILSFASEYQTDPDQLKQEQSRRLKQTTRQISIKQLSEHKEVALIPPQKLTEILKDLSHEGFIKKTSKPGIFAIL
jgi:A/G-specific adenine glycosylase